MKFSVSSRERTAGLFLIGSVLLVTAFFIGAAVRNRWFSPRVSYHTLLTRGDGLRPGSPVLLSGVEVGYIGDVTIREDERVDVELVVLAEHTRRLKQGIHAAPRRLLGIGDKRMHLVPKAGATELLPPGSEIPAVEPMEVLDLVETIDMGQYVRTLDKTLAALDRNLSRLDENGRIDTLFAMLDRLGPLLDHLDSLVTQTSHPLTTLLKDPALPQALHGVVAFTTDPAMHPLIKNAATALDDRRLDRLLTRAEEVFAKVDRLTSDDGHLGHLLTAGDKLLGDGRADRLLGSMDRLADEKKLGALVDHVGVLADQMAHIGPEIPGLTKDLQATMKEAVVVLKAVQQTWMLEKESKKARSDIEKQ
jgi:phospholipid/cholesterol/gamma-HCH transport system substrate-binding protein